MSKTVEFFLDLGSPATYLASTQLPALCARHGARLVYKPILLGGVFQATGNASPVMVPAKGRYMRIDLKRYADRYGVPLTLPPGFPVNTLNLMRGLIGIQLFAEERFEGLLKVLFEGLFVHGRNLADPAVLDETLAAGGFEAEMFHELAARPEVKDALRKATEEAVERGLFGAPTFFVDGQMFFGQDRLDFVEQALVRQA
ncbi:2-hydroxychromene-2-carboxylate isomerase [Pseudomonas sp. CCOS 191]|uniref:2-hydroxychromene-2-carboxylate isomerase n=1 Tax=Pseudomonas sp. CCOS 191 TaxID=1649877 RepID=UPI00062438D4|nr:2-hydroxychromene-2-carboxylate isomerase [Pseudomonas sp. CCOS 191]CRI57502.1 DSBA oxidoreductase [Pseudomonas sp. CCOS 191]